MKRVLFVSSLYHPHVGGIETMVTELSEFYRKKGIQTVSFTKRWPLSLSESDEYHGTNIYRVASARTQEEFEIIIDWVKKNESKLKADVIHVIGIRRPLPLVALLLARLWRIPVVCTIAGGDIPDKNDAYTASVWKEGVDFIPDVLRQADCVNCVSRALSKDLKELMPDLEGVETLYAGIDSAVINSIAPEKLKEQYIFSLRRLDPSKGIDILIRAFNQIKDKFPDLHLVIAGEGPEEHNLKQLVDSFALGGRITFIGSVEMERGIALLKSAELTVVPSISEGGGLVNIEAQAAGCPVIASRVGGIPEYIKEGESGLFFESGNYMELADKISTLLLDKKLRKKLVGGGYKHSQQFDWGVLAPQYVNLYQEVIKSYNQNKSFKPWSDLTKDLWWRLTH